MSRPTNFATSAPDEIHRVLDAGWQVCSDWPHGFHLLLDGRRQRARERKGRYGVQKNFGSLRAWIERNPEPFAAFLSAALTAYIVDCPELATRSPAIRQARSAAAIKHRTVTIGEARETLGVGLDAMHSLAVQHGLYLVPPTGSGAPALLRADLVGALQQKRSRLLSKEDVRKLLGTGKATVDKLREAGLLPTEPDLDGVRYPAAGVEALLGDLESRVPPDANMPKRTVAMATIARQVPRPGFDVCDVIEAVRVGALTPAGVSAKARGLHRLRFKQTDVDRFVAEVTAIPGRRLSLTEAAKALGVKKEVAYHWARSGLLATVTVDSPSEPGNRVTRAALAGFQREYITGSEFAGMHRLGRKWAATHLLMAGVQAVSGPSVDGGRQYLFRRADLEGFDAERLVSGRSKMKPKTARALATERRARSATEDALDQALKQQFAGGLVRRYHQYRDEGTGTVIQAMTANNRGTAGLYEFLLSAKQRAELAKAARGFLALAFADRADFLLVPWQEMEPLLPTLPSYESRHGRVVRLWIRADASGQLTPFGGSARLLKLFQEA